ncbi:MAG: alpha/beta fold hydrolase [Pseudomonadota bacterium]
MSEQYNANTSPLRKPPAAAAILGEIRAPFESALMLPLLARAHLFPRKARKRQPVMVIPGFGVGDEATAPLRYFLARQGHETRGWELGRNLAGADIKHQLSDLSDRWEFEPREDYRGEAGVPILSDRLAESVLAWSRSLESPVTLIGWSLGGSLAREVARDFPEHVRQVITLGSPVLGGPKYTTTARFFRERGLDLDWIEREIDKRQERPLKVPVTAIYSPNDGIVSATAARDDRETAVNYIKVSASHIGMPFNPRVWRRIQATLDAI